MDNERPCNEKLVGEDVRFRKELAEFAKRFPFCMIAGVTFAIDANSKAHKISFSIKPGQSANRSGRMLLGDTLQKDVTKIVQDMKVQDQERLIDELSDDFSEIMKACGVKKWRDSERKAP